MTLKINNEVISASDLTGGNSELRYFGLDSALLVPNKAGNRLLGSPLQNNLLKQFANSSINYNINYTPKISNIINNIDNTSLFTTTSIDHKVFTGDSGKYVLLANNANFMPDASKWDIYIDYTYKGGGLERPIICLSNGNYSGVFVRTDSSGTLGVCISFNGGTWNIFTSTSLKLTNNVKYYFHIYFTGTDYKIDYRLNTTNDWTNCFNYSSSTKVSSQNLPVTLFAWKYNYNSYYSSGSVDMTSLLITYDDTVFFNGATASENTDYTNYGCTETTESYTAYENDSFIFSFSVDSSIFTSGTKYLLEHPNLILIKTENNSLFFNFPWLSKNWKSLPSGILISGTNNISIVGTSDTITLIVNGHNFPIVSLAENMPLITTGYMAYRESFDI